MAEACSTTASPTINVKIIYIEVERIIAAMPVKIGINALVRPVEKPFLVKYKRAVTTMLTMLKIYTINPEINFIRLVVVQITSNINVPITAQAHKIYRTFVHMGKVWVAVYKIETAPMIIAIPNSE